MSSTNMAFRLTTLEDDGREIYVSGSFNNWDPTDPRYRMKKIAEGKYELKVSLPSEISYPIEYKYAKGNWENEEITRTGQKTKNRTLTKRVRSVSDKVARFRYNGNSDYNRFLPIIEKVNDFLFPSLPSRRAIQVLLPYNYYINPDKRYKVLYLNDGQNLWDKSAPFGNWSLDQKIAQLSAGGKNNVIVVAIDHGGQERIKEYKPINGTRVGKADGQKYLRDIVNCVKPYIDSKYRTLPQRENTGIGGSSMGGLISIYAGIMFPDIFGKLMIFSPSLWIIQNSHIETLRFFTPFHTKIYLYAGGKESASMLPSMRRLKHNLEAQDFFQKVIDVKLTIDPKGRHTETKWGKEVVSAVTWLFYS